MQIYKSLDEVVERGSIAPDSIINADCLEAMKFIPDKSIDCIICDLPYSITNCHWDKLIPFEPLWEQYKRIVKPNGAIVLFGSQPFTSALVMSNPKWFKYEWIWEKNKNSNFYLGKVQPLRCHENILIFSDRKINYSPILRWEGIKDRRKTFTVFENKNGSTLPFKKPRKKDDGYRLPKSVLKFSNADTTNSIHPTQKPVALIEYLVKTYTLENEIIVDNTAGSGTLAIAAINTNRRYICIEKDPGYFDVMRNRIENHDPNALVTTKKTRKPKAIPEGQLRLFG